MKLRISLCLIAVLLVALAWIHHAANAKDKQGMTPLHLATADDHTDKVKLLLACGADVNARDNRGFTP